MDFIESLGSEARALLESGAPLLLPDINLSSERTIAEGDTLRMGFDCIKGLSSEFVHAILEERLSGRFAHFCDFLARMPFVYRNDAKISALIRCGAFDCFGHARVSMLNWKGDDPQKTLDALHDLWNRAAQVELAVDDKVTLNDRLKQPVFSGIAKRIGARAAQESLAQLRSMEELSLFNRPYELQLRPYRKALALMWSKELREKGRLRCGRISHITTVPFYDHEAKRRQYAVYAFLEDDIGLDRIEFITTKKAYESMGIRENALVQMKEPLDGRTYGTASAEWIRPMPSARELMRKVVISLNACELTDMKVFQLKETLEGYPGIDSVHLRISSGEKQFDAMLPMRVDAEVPLPSFIHGIFDHVRVSVVSDTDLY